VSDVTGLPQEVLAETVGAAYGDAQLAAKGVGLVAPMRIGQGSRGPWTPEPGFRSLYPATRDQAHALAAIQRREAEPEVFRS
jgi:xylulokinase